MRKPTHEDAHLLLRLYEMRRDPELRAARAWIISSPPLAWEEVKSRYLSHDEQDRHARMVTSYWQMVGTLVNRGVLHPELFFEHTGEDIVTWDKCQQWVEGARRDIRATYCSEFEDMVKAHRAYREKKIAEHARRGNTASAPPAKSSRPAKRSR